MLFVVLFTFSCSVNDDDNDTDITEEERNLISNHVTSGTWRITKFIDSGEDELYHFTGFDFTFAGNGTLTAANTSVTHTGTWSITRDSSDDDDDDDDDSSDLDFNIMFNLTNEFEELNDDWDIISHSANKIELIDISGGNGGTDYLTFQKN